MNTKYFNKWSFEQAVSLIHRNPVEAKTKFEEYIKEYPEDYLAYSYYSGVLTTLKELDKAEQVLDYVEKLVKNDSKYLSYEEKRKILNYNLYLSRVRLLLFKEKYEELYQLSIDTSLYGETIELGFLKNYCMNKLHIPVEYDKYNHSYLYNQIYCYSLNNFYEHIKPHLAEFNENIDNQSIGTFVVGFPITKVLSEIKKYLSLSNCLYSGLYDDLYVFKYDECGRVSGKLVNYFRVVYFHNTDYIITIYPSADSEYLPCIDLNYLNDTKDNYNQNKVKRISQIDKFNKKYKL